MAFPRATSPFPGMDPYLERDWKSVHPTFLVFTAFALNDVLPDDLVARPEKRVVLDHDEQDDEREPSRTPHQVNADVRVVASAGEVCDADVGGAVPTLARPGTLAVRAVSDPLMQTSVSVRDPDDERVITVLEMLSPTNKRNPGRREFIERRRELLAGGTNVVEIDLIRAGD